MAIGGLDARVDRAGRDIAVLVRQCQSEDLGIRGGGAIGAEIDRADRQSRHSASGISQWQAEHTVRVVPRIGHAVEDRGEEDIVIVAERRALQQQRFVVDDLETCRLGHGHRRAIILETDA